MHVLSMDLDGSDANVPAKAEESARSPSSHHLNKSQVKATISSNVVPAETPAVWTHPRVLGHQKGTQPGPKVVLVGGMHGNEPAGVKAIRSVFTQLPKEFSGEIWGLAGNLGGLRRNKRFLDRDLNRHWVPEQLQGLCQTSPDDLQAEAWEQRDLLRQFHEIIGDDRKPITFIDLHTMSGPGAPFICMADVLRNRRVAFSMPIPIVLGLEEVIEGSMLGYLCDLGHAGMAVEGGQHEDEASIDRLETVSWLALLALGVVNDQQIPDLARKRERLAQAAINVPSVVEIRHRHVCSSDDGFTMKPGFSSFDPIKKGQVLAEDTQGEIKAPMSGMMLLPRYQGVGSDGFFVARLVRKFWLHLSAGLRHLGADRGLTYMPGVKKHPEREGVYLVDPEIARVRVTEIFHLFGFRKVSYEGKLLAFSRRRPDNVPTSSLPVLLTSPSLERRNA